ncbi:MAG: hypothetical protein EDM05_67780 [Leptolyngbya sp. IPPAS B-1204]|nr:hypothetical protein [Elainella sp. C42_A2020_010]RNJ69078.1 MAG: hypothetical protein EDM05_11155 [Leptolyngbya sp. IPPAS B-1204]
MARTAQWLTIGLTAAVFSALAGCSSPSPSNSAAETSSEETAQTASQPAETSTKSDKGGEPFRVVENVQLQPGADPMTIVLATRQPSPEPVGSEQIKVNYPSPDKAVVTVTKTGLQDDSVAATRTRYEFTPSDSATEGTKQWQLVQVTEQNKCQANRGSQEWTGELCQ